MIFVIGFTSNHEVYSEEPITVSTDKSQYTKGETIFLNGRVIENLERPLGISVINPLDDIVTVDQIYPSSDGTFSTQFSTSGWQYSGTYIISVGHPTGSTKISFEFVGTQDALPTKTEGRVIIKNTNSYADYVIYDATLHEVQANADRTSLTILIDAQDDGSISIIVPYDVIIMDITENRHIVFVDGQKTENYGMSSNVGNYHSIDVRFSAGAKKIEIISNDGVITQPTITVSTDKTSYKSGDIISITGKTTIVNIGVTIVVTAPNGNIIAIDNISPNYSGNFATQKSTSSSLWELTGTYTITAQQGTQNHATSTFYFESSQQQPSDCGPNQVFQLGMCQDIVEAGIAPFIIETDQPSYNDGDIIRISGIITSLNENFAQAVTLVILDPSGNIVTVDQIIPDSSGAFSTLLDTTEVSMKTTGDYVIKAQYGAQKTTITFSFTASRAPSSGIVDTVPPLLLAPSDMTIDANDSSGARVDYSVKAIDDVDGVLRPNCSPSSGSLFPIGETTVTCSATDNSGNYDKKSFVITVNVSDVLIPSWIKDVAGFWCGDEIDDASFIEAIQYLIDNDVIVVPVTTFSGSGSQEIPSWIKNNACWWSQGLITNSDFASGLQYLIGQGIIRI